MAVVVELIRSQEDGTLCFGNHTLDSKTKVEDYSAFGSLYKVKTFKELTKLERDGMFVYESEPGTSVNNFKALENGVAFTVSGAEDAMITVGLVEDTEYVVTVDGKNIGTIKTNLGGKLSFSVALDSEKEVDITIEK